VRPGWRSPPFEFLKDLRVRLADKSANGSDEFASPVGMIGYLFVDLLGRGHWGLLRQYNDGQKRWANAVP
jgi:hypothetical protein